MEHEIELHILRQLMYNKGLSYNEILDKQFPSNKFNYYLKKYVDEGFIKKDDETYSLTSDGMHLLSTLDGVTLKKKRHPIVCCFVLGVDGEKILVNKRLKQPFLGYVGIPGGKLDLGNDLLPQAQEEFLDETGLSGELELKVISNYVTYEGEDIAHHVVGFTYVARNLSGKLKEKHREGENFFINKSELLEHKVYPDIPKLIESCFIEGISKISAKRFVENGEFVGIEFY